MDFEELRKIPFGDVVKAIVTEGGATASGFIGAGVLGRRIQAMVKPDAEIVTGMDKVYAWAGNNGLKALAWYFLRGRPVLGVASEDFNKGIVTSVAFDTIMRLSHGGKNPATATLFGYEALGDGSMVGAGDATVSRLLTEVSALRAENARLRSGGVAVQQVPYAAQTPMDPRLPPYVGGELTAQVVPPAERERKYAFMQPAIPGVTRTPGAAEREKKYGFASGTPNMSAMTTGKPGAAYVQAGKMFGMR